LKKTIKQKKWLDKDLYIFLLPAIIATFLFGYLPMFSNVIAFMDYNILDGWMGLQSPFVGFKWFIIIFKDPEFVRMCYRTLYYSVLSLAFRFPASFLLAIFINEIRNRTFKRVTQTFSYLPHFISWVTMASLIYIFLTSDINGIMNNIREMLGAKDRIIYMRDANNFPWILAWSSVYKGMGWGSIMYLAAITGVDPSLYEAATIDGANRFDKFVHITFPSILPTTMILLIFSLGALFSSNFGQIYNLQNDIIRQDTYTINVYTYYQGILNGRYSQATAAGLFQGVINCILLVSADRISKKVTSYGLF